MGEAIGGKSTYFEWFQVHLSGRARLDDPDAKVKFLAAETPLSCNHDTGNSDLPRLIERSKVMDFECLLPVYDEQPRSQPDPGIHADIVHEVSFVWKVRRDAADRGWTEKQVKEDNAKRWPVFFELVNSKKAHAEVSTDEMWKIEPPGALFHLRLNFVWADTLVDCLQKQGIMGCNGGMWKIEPPGALFQLGYCGMMDGGFKIVEGAYLRWPAR